MADHDNSYHALFSHPEMVEDLLRNFITQEWVDQLDFSGMERINAKFHTDGFDKREGDIIFRIPYESGDGEIYVYLLLEFQSTPDKWMPLRIATYACLLYQQIIKEKQLTDDHLLPPVFPLVLYNGDQPWTYPQDLQSLIALPPDSPLQQWQLQMSFYLLNESAYPYGKTGADTLTGVLFGIENVKNVNELRECFKALVKLIPQTEASLRRAFLLWIDSVILPHKGLQLDKQDLQNLTKVDEMLSTRIKEWEQEIEERGRQEGEAAIVVKMLELKFGPLPEWVEHKIDQANNAMLEQWAANLLNAINLDDVFK